ncbi:YhgE/Pip domain-containing protein [Paenibacillus radicis (ex Gao et al. 2016)]|uniref:Phage infection protein n=1 Tax=Paenibacillus radicis (ex Gao et al. 2016) TaxID=1737354 RepID=A0A917LY12_9BACL|nr:YhgE/Pip domain-containing protein [Paenibacillus radicis (ex Gao et al. 2016)]GGG66365.1 phage infection protein [Paenibacillus radicis (ex Gao et al. 2016)]
MKSIFRLYARDLSGIVRNWAAIITLLGLICLPSLYAWFNIEASWDPYGNTSGLAVAVANNDEGATLRGTPLNAGAEVIDSLKSNHKIGWVFVDEKQALKGVKHGDYYASIVIPANFSAKIATVLNDKPEQSAIEYYVNEKINAVSPKIAASGANGIIQEIRNTFIKTANGAIFSLLNEVGLELEQERPTIENTRDLVLKLEKLFPEINAAVNTASTDAGKAETIVAKAQAALPDAVKLVKDGQQLSGKLGVLLTDSAKALAQAAPSIKQDLQLLSQTAKAAVDLADALKNGELDPEEAKTALNAIAGKLATAERVAGSAASLFGQLADTTGSSRLASVGSKLKQAQSRFAQAKTTVTQIAQAIDRGEEPAAQLVTKLHDAAAEASSLLDGILAKYDSEIVPGIEQGLAKAQSAAQKANSVLKQTAADMPDVEKILKDAAKGLTFGKEALVEIKKRMPNAEQKIKGLADRIRQLEKEGSLDEVIELLRNNAQRESAFFAEPVVLNENRLYPIPNYGSAMSPFFSTLSIWVGALLLVSLLSADPHPAEGESLKSYQIYFGRYLTFLTIALLQSVLITTGDIWVLGTYVVDKLAFILFGLLISVVFMVIVYTLVSVFGNVGKALAIVLLVLQLAGSGGTFPIQVTPPFFQAIHPYLPFTYAISIMREAVGGILWDIVWRDLFWLGVIAGIALVIGLALKKVINRASAGFLRKVKESDLIH